MRVPLLSGSLALVLVTGQVSALAQPMSGTPPAAGPVNTVNAAPTFVPEELEALVAPIALYPDSLLAQVLMASTYPLEVVQAARWVKANTSVKGEAAVRAVADKTWDVSVKSLVAFPQVLEPMDDRLDWTQKLGDAFLAQQKDVLDAVQRLRLKAQGNGNLKTTEQQNVIVDQAPSGGAQQTIVRIEPANPEVIYVPTYDPTYVYGSWGYPAYPPYYWPLYPAYYPGYYPGYYVGAGIAFGVGFAVGAAIFGGCNWSGGEVNVNVNRAANIDRNFDHNRGQGANGRWQHDAGHRKGVSYRDNATRERFGKNVGGADGRAGFRGFDGLGNRAAGGSPGGTGRRGSAGEGGAARNFGGGASAGIAGDARTGGAPGGGASAGRTMPSRGLEAAVPRSGISVADWPRPSSLLPTDRPRAPAAAVVPVGQVSAGVRAAVVGAAAAVDAEEQRHGCDQETTICGRATCEARPASTLARPGRSRCEREQELQLTPGSDGSPRAGGLQRRRS